MTDTATCLNSESLVLRPSKFKWAGIAALSFLFVAAAVIVIATSGDPLPWAVLPWLVLSPAIAFFGFSFLVALAVLIWPGNRLEIDDEGFTLCSFGRKRRIAWRDTSWNVNACRHNVVCTYDTHIPGFGHLELPFGYGRSPEDLARIMNERRARADAREGFDAVREERNRDAGLVWW